MTGPGSALFAFFIATFILLLAASLVVFFWLEVKHQPAQAVKYACIGMLLAGIPLAIMGALNGTDILTVVFIFVLYEVFIAAGLVLQLFKLSVSERGLSMTLRLAARKLKELFGR